MKPDNSHLLIMTERGRITFFQVQMRIWTKSTERWTEERVMNGFKGLTSLHFQVGLREKSSLSVVTG